MTSAGVLLTRVTQTVEVGPRRRRDDAAGEHEREAKVVDY
jgi:hypothetical protein